MTRNESGQFGRLRKRAAIFAALFFCATAVAAQDVVLRSEGGGLNISGPLIGFDGENIQIGSPNGPLTLRYDRVICEGVDCPDLATYVPELRLSGARRMADVLMPALVESFARSQQLQVTLDQIDDSHFVQTLQRAGALQPAGRFSFRTTNTDEGFADLIANETDIVMSVREVRRSEVRLGAEVGLGQLDDPRQSRIVGLDALVPVLAAAASVSAISLADLAAAYSGEITDWSKITGSSDPMTVHLGPVTNGQAQRFIDEVVRGGDRKLSIDIVRHPDNAAVADAVAGDFRALGVLPFADVGNAQPIALRDACGFISAPRLTALKTEDYPLTAPMFLYLPKRRLPPLARDFLAWLRGPEAQLVVRRAGFVDQGAVPIPLDAQGQRFANAIAAAGNDMPLIELQRMVRVLAARVRLSTSFRFEIGSTRLDAQSRSNLLALAQAIRDDRYKDRPLMLVGFSDGRGAADANRDLSSARAEAVLRDLKALMGGGCQMAPSSRQRRLERPCRWAVMIPSGAVR